MHGEQEFQRRLELIERTIRELEATSDAGLRATMRQLVQSIMELHGASLDRLIEIVREADAARGPHDAVDARDADDAHDAGEAHDAGDAIVDRLGADPLVGSLLILYGLHPRDVRSRVEQGLDAARAALAGLSLTLDQLDEEASAMRVRVSGIRHGQMSSVEQVRQTIEDALRANAPDVASIAIEDETAAAPVGASPLVLTDRGGRPLHPRATAASAALSPSVSPSASASSSTLASDPAVAMEGRPT